jgi:hypothetical protein
MNKVREWLKRKPEPVPEASHVAGFWDYVHRHPLIILAVLLGVMFLALASCASDTRYPTIAGESVGVVDILDVIRAFIDGDIAVAPACLEQPQLCEVRER